MNTEDPVNFETSMPVKLMLHGPAGITGVGAGVGAVVFGVRGGIGGIHLPVGLFTIMPGFAIHM